MWMNACCVNRATSNDSFPIKFVAPMKIICEITTSKRKIDVPVRARFVSSVRSLKIGNFADKCVWQLFKLAALRVGVFSMAESRWLIVSKSWLKIAGDPSKTLRRKNRSRRFRFFPPPGQEGPDRGHGRRKFIKQVSCVITRITCYGTQIIRRNCPTNVFGTREK